MNYHYKILERIKLLIKVVLVTKIYIMTHTILTREIKLQFIAILFVNLFIEINGDAKT